MELETNQQHAGVLSSGPPLDSPLPAPHVGPQREPAPEHRLMITILHDALDCLTRYRSATDRHGRRLFRQAQEWLFTDDADWPYSFECICAVLDLDPNAMRQRLRIAI